MSDSDSIADEPEEQVQDQFDNLVKPQLERMDEEAARDALFLLVDACVGAITASSVESKRRIVDSLRQVIGEETFRALANNYAQIFGEPWDEWADTGADE
jgi:hypothetical protein